MPTENTNNVALKVSNHTITLFQTHTDTPLVRGFKALYEKKKIRNATFILPQGMSHTHTHTHSRLTALDRIAS